MILQCTECETKMRPKPAADTKPGTKVQITCRCGQKLRFTMPGKPKATGSPMDFSGLAEMFKGYGI